jgi:acyl-CoA thioesterase I
MTEGDTMTQRYLIIVLAAALLFVAGCGSRKAPSPSPQPASTPTVVPAPSPSPPGTGHPILDGRPVILALGDSLTEGLRVPVEENYPSRLQRELDALDYRYQVINAGVSGDTAANGAARIDSLLAAYRPALVILELGANDGLRGLPVRQMRDHLETIIVTSQQAGAEVVLAGMRVPPNLGPDYVEAYERTFPALAEAHGLTLIQFFLEGVGGSRELNQTDGIHPTGEGYAIVTKTVLDAILPLLQK